MTHLSIEMAHSVSRDRPLHVCHVTSVHPRTDTRVMHKMCLSVARTGVRVTLLIADGGGSGVTTTVQVIDIGRSRGRLSRAIRAWFAFYRQLQLLPADIIQLHDPELLPLGVALKLRGRTVIFDSHESVPDQIRTKPYLQPGVAMLVSWLYAGFERLACKALDGIVAATPVIRDKFLTWHARVIDINNFPMVDELEPPGDCRTVHHHVCYVGGISRIRGAVEMVRAMEHATDGVRLQLAGHFVEHDLRAELEALPGWSKVDYLGHLDRSGVRDLLGRSIAGLVTLHPAPNYLDSFPVKMFEYMSAGLPVIASDFALWRSILDGAGCGLLVNPLDPKSIANAINRLSAHSEEALAMGARGRVAVLDRFNWACEEQKLLHFYGELLASRAVAGH